MLKEDCITIINLYIMMFFVKRISEIFTKKEIMRRDKAIKFQNKKVQAAKPLEP